MQTMSSILERIAANKKLEVEKAKRICSLESLSENSLPPTRDFIAALQTKNPSIIAEIKRASPSKGLIRVDFDVATIAKIYTEHGASCLSVLTEIDFFQGDPRYLSVAKANSPLPLLRKDFIIDPYQIYESRVLGADCILLIVALLDDQQLHDYCQMAQELDMAVLVESHTFNELERALVLPTALMGINNRSLHTFDIDIQCTLDLKQYIPADKLVVTESGITHHDDVKRMQANGINTFLVGESLMRSDDIAAQLQQLIHG